MTTLQREPEEGDSHGRHRARQPARQAMSNAHPRRHWWAFSYFAFDFDRLVLQSLRSLTLLSTFDCFLRIGGDYKPTSGPPAWSQCASRRHPGALRRRRRLEGAPTVEISCQDDWIF